ncbi:MAG TPA: hypothetical protein VK203_27015 [Nostocaceae cyanobacterium]|nr:hypothetical protein [Nostocaceae cyanobacterium]
MFPENKNKKSQNISSAKLLPNIGTKQTDDQMVELSSQELAGIFGGISPIIVQKDGSKSTSNIWLQ